MIIFKHKNSFFRICTILFMQFILATVLNPANAYCEVFQKKQLLVLNSYHKGFKWTDDITLGIELALKDKGRSVMIHYEYMDTKRISGPDYFNLLRDTYRFKFRNMKFDAIIVSDNDSLDFILTYRTDLFPDTPVIFCGINNFVPQQLQGARKITGVNESADIRETVELAL